MRSGSKFLAFALSLAASIAATPAQSSLIADGITYTLIFQTTANPNVDNFELMITGIKGPSDTELGRFGGAVVRVQSTNRLRFCQCARRVHRNAGRPRFKWVRWLREFFLLFGEHHPNRAFPSGEL
jgi:hypothetical protein